MPLGRWLYDGLRSLILESRLKPGHRLPSTRDLARLYSVSRGIVVAVFEQLLAEGYLTSKVGSGTVVNKTFPDKFLQVPFESGPRFGSRREPAPTAFATLPRAFRCFEPALDKFPMEVWARVASRRLHRASRRLLANGDARGYAPLRETIAAYLGSSRGVRCSPDQVIVVSGVQQALDLVARLILKPGDPVWMEDPGYPGARAAFQSAGAKIVPVRVGESGLDIKLGQKLCPRAKAAYVSPAHQFPLGMIMPIQQRLALLDWAHRSGAVILEDDYDSEFRYVGSPMPALQGLDTGDSVVFLGSFNKVLFPSLRIGYLVVPGRMVEPMAALRFNADRYCSTLDQAILCDFITEGHFGRHLRRMRECYHGRFRTLIEALLKSAGAPLDVPEIPAGLHAAAFLQNGIAPTQAVTAAKENGVEVMALDRFSIARRDIRGLLLGFAAIGEPEIRRGVVQLTRAIEKIKPRGSTAPSGH
jgi:GntR family transcriptional regulator/MocR family aminotransferase